MTAEEKFEEVFTLGFAGMPPHIPKYIYQAMIEFAQYHVEEALKAASDLDFESIEHPEADDYEEAVKFTIMECYPKKNIK